MEATLRPWRLNRVCNTVVKDVDGEPYCLASLGNPAKAVVSVEQMHANARLIVEAVNNYDRLRKIERLAGELAGIVKPFLADLVKRPRSSASMQRIGSDAEEILKAAQSLIVELKDELEGKS